MNPEDDTIKKLQKRLDELGQKHENYAEEIRELREVLEGLLNAEAERTAEVSREEQPLKAESWPKKDFPAPDAAPTKTAGASRKFQRNRKNRILAGVCYGLAEYLQINPAITRVLFVLFSLLFCIGPVIYLLLWVIMPAAPLFGTQRVPSDPQHPVAPKEEAPLFETRQTPYPQGPEVRKGESPLHQASRLEKFVGENLLGKVGIVILVIGVSIGAKYSIDNDLISPLMRIILGYLVGALLFLTGTRLRPRYENFSAVLLSGAMAIMYFITFAAYVFYGMYPQWLAFMLMVIFTCGTVGISLQYNLQFIAIIGLVGAYCIPFLLSEGKGEPAVLFSYMGIINLGVLFIAFRKYWKPLFLFAFGMTWLIFISWYSFYPDGVLYTTLCWGFLVFFFLLFYATFLSYKLLKKEAFNYTDVMLLLLNGFIFYGIGYDLLETSPDGAGFLGVFTLLNACVHAGVAALIHRREGADATIFLLVSGLALVFLTITIPVQLDGNWVTLLWMAEATLLFWIGRTRQVALYETLAYPLIVLGVFSLAQDWSAASAAWDSPEANPAFFNAVFLTALLSSAALGYIAYLFFTMPRFLKWTQESRQGEPLSFAVSGLFLLVLFGAFAVEISRYWDQVYAGFFPADTAMAGSYEAPRTFGYIQALKQVWLLNYTLLFLSVLALVNNYKVKNRTLGLASLLLNLIALFVFLTSGLYQLSELRDHYIDGSLENVTGWSAGVRYLSLLLLAVLLMASHRLLKQPYLNLRNPVLSESILAVVVGWVATSELLHWLALSQVSDSYKLWVSVFWGLYALVLVGFGLWRIKRHLRIGGIALFFLTLLKVFFFDLTHLSTISKTIVFISLGVFLLIVSYLYQRFKAAISEEDEALE